jgi:dihydropyrimidine dehydrogenase (NAD+) subunit PreT
MSALRIHATDSSDAIDLVDALRAHGLSASLADTPGAWEIDVLAAPAEADGRFAELRPPLSDDEARIAADQCLECLGHAPAPCVLACPADVDVPSFVEAIAEGDNARAAKTIFAENFLGSSCARVCPAEVLCQGACVLADDGHAPVPIAALQRYATDWALEHGINPGKGAPPNGLRVVVIGAGPAGLACAGELASLGYAVTVYDEREEIGGLVRYAIAPYRLQRDPLPEELRALEALGVQLRLGSAIDSREKLAALGADADAVVLAIGLGPDVDAGYPGDELPGVWESLRFVEALKTGSAPEIGPRVAVIGGGNTAVDVAREALRLGADEVTLLYRRTDAEMPAYAHEVVDAREEGVRFEWLVSPRRFIGDEHVEGVECMRMELGAPDGSGRRRPNPLPGSEFVVPVDTVIKAIGQQPRTGFLGWIEGLEVQDGLVVVDPETGRTGNPKFFAAGDAINGGATAVEAVGGAKRAARAIDAWLGDSR